MLHLQIAAAIVLLLSMTGKLRAQDELPPHESQLESSYPETWPSDTEALSGDEWSAESHDASISTPGPYSYGFPEHLHSEEAHAPPWFWPKPRWLGLRHSSTHGRNVGRGQPLTGTSWQNRPFYVGAEIGPVWFTEPIDDHVSTDIDTFGGIFFGWDTDHYWGNELHFDWSTPEFRNSQAPDANYTDSAFTWTYNYLYYPWGDAKVRPYWRAGIGTSHFDWPTVNGTRDDESMWTFPLGAGVKYPIRRWLAARADLTDYLSLESGRPTQHNVALTFGLEWRFGAHPPSYWPWNPQRHIW